MDKLSVKSLPFVKASRTVTRSNDNTNGGHLLVSRSQNVKDDIPIQEDKSYTGLKVDDNCVTVTVRRNSISNRKRKSSKFEIDLSSVKPCSLEELPPPFKLRKKFQIKSKTEKSLTKRLRSEQTSKIITEHVMNLKRKQLALFKKVEFESNSPPHQVVPPSPQLNSSSTSNDTFIEEPAVFSTSTMSSVYPSYLNSYDGIVLEGSAGERAVEPLFGANNIAEETYSFPESTLDFLPEPPTSLSGNTPFSLPLPSPPSLSPVAFNLRTFGIQMFFPREE